MRATVARRLRKKVCGEDNSAAARKYFKHRTTGAVVSDPLRRMYQGLKKRYTARNAPKGEGKTGPWEYQLRRNK